MHFIISIILFSQLISCTGTEQKSSQKQIVKQDKSQDSIPLFIVGTYLHDDTSISIKEIIRGVKSGSISITGDLQEFVKSIWSIDNPRIQSLQTWNDRSRTALMLMSIDSLSNRFLPLEIDSIDYFSHPKSYPLHLISSHPFSFDKHVTTYVHTGVTALTRSTGIYLDKYLH